MSKNKGIWEDIGISNDFLFGKIMSNPEICKEMLQIIFPKMEIDHIEYPEAQKHIDMDKDARSIRIDIYVKDGRNTIYSIEMQVLNQGNLPKRSRYYQGMIDLQLVDRGISYSNLNHTYIIFICPFDLFGKGRYMYTFNHICEEDTSIHLNDEATKIFLNAKGNMDDVGEDLKAFLNYVVGIKSDNDFVKKLENAVKEAKRNREWRHEYMTLFLRDQDNIELGKELGKEQGEEMMSQLVQILLRDNRTSDIERVIQDKEYRHKLYKEYKIVSD